VHRRNGFAHGDETLTPLSRYEKILELVNEREQEQNASITVLNRFKTATERRLEELVLCGESEAKRNSRNCANETIVDGYREVDILEDVNVPANDPSRIPMDMSDEPLVHSMVHFLLGENKAIAGLRKNPEPVRKKLCVFVSLSGGVDSMVIARVLAFIRDSNAILHLNDQNNSQNGISPLKRKRKKPRKAKKLISEKQAEMAKMALEKQKQARSKKYENTVIDIHVVAIHIDYGNRPESRAEAEYVNRWCVSHGIIFKRRRIDEFKRGSTPRDVYERRTREIRFDMYKHVMKEFDCSGGIMFGHHIGDLQENVISNVMKGTGILELSGMQKVSQNMGISIYRPFLDNTKAEIYEFAHRHNVPYFKDTTPRWSTRGKLRNNLLPTISETYGTGFLAHLSALAGQSNEVHSFMKKKMFIPFWEKVRYGKLGTIVSLEGHFDSPPFFWRHALKEVCHRMGCGSIHEKPIGVFMATLQSLQKTYNGQQHICWVELKSDNRCFFYKKNSLVLLQNAFIHSSTQPPSFSNAAISSLSTSSETPVKVNNAWTITVRPRKNEATLKPFDLEAFCLNGTVSYVIPMSESYVFCPKNGADLEFFKKVAKKLRIAIPIIVPCQVETKASNGHELVVVTLCFSPNAKN